MTYTVYIPDTERGPTAYTQRQFDTIKALAKWAMDAALDEPAAPVSKPAIEITGAPDLNNISDVVPPDSKQQAPIDKLLSLLKVPTGAPAVAVSTDLFVKKPVPVDEYTDDTDSWFSDVSESVWAEPLRSRNWKRVAEMYLGEIPLNTDGPGTIRVAHEEYQWLYSLFVNHPQVIADNLFPDTEVRWAELPPAFMKACTEALSKKEDYVYQTQKHIDLPLAKDAITVLKFFQAGRRHESWKDVTIEASEGLVWGAAAAEKTAEKLLIHWWKNQKPTDAMREFMLRAIVLQYYKHTTEASIIGSSEFLTSYTECVQRMGKEGVLPAAFMDWVTRGTAYKHCKNALTALGIASVRRSDGQKYANLVLNQDSWSGAADKSVWIFENDLSGFEGGGMCGFADWSKAM